MKKAITLGIRLPIEVHEKLNLYVKIYDREICRPRNSYTDTSKIVRAIIVTLLMKKGLLGYEFAELTDPCYTEYAEREKNPIVTSNGKNDQNVTINVTSSDK